MPNDNETRSRNALEKIASVLERLERTTGTIAREFLSIEKHLGGNNKILVELVEQLKIANEPIDIDEAEETLRKVQEMTEATERLVEVREVAFPEGPRWVEGLPVQVITPGKTMYGWEGIIEKVNSSVITVRFTNGTSGGFGPNNLRIIGEEDGYKPRFWNDNCIARVPNEFDEHFKKGPVLNPKQFLQETPPYHFTVSKEGELTQHHPLSAGSRPEAEKKTIDELRTLNRLDTSNLFGGEIPMPSPHNAYDAFVAWVFEEAARNGIDPKHITFVQGDQKDYVNFCMDDDFLLSSDRRGVTVAVPKDVAPPSSRWAEDHFGERSPADEAAWKLHLNDRVRVVVEGHDYTGQEGTVYDLSRKARKVTFIEVVMSDGAKRVFAAGEIEKIDEPERVMLGEDPAESDAIQTNGAGESFVINPLRQGQTEVWIDPHTAENCEVEGCDAHFVINDPNLHDNHDDTRD